MVHRDSMKVLTCFKMSILLMVTFQLCILLLLYSASNNGCFVGVHCHLEIMNSPFLEVFSFHFRERSTQSSVCKLNVTPTARRS